MKQELELSNIEKIYLFNKANGLLDVKIEDAMIAREVGFLVSEDLELLESDVLGYDLCNEGLIKEEPSNHDELANLLVGIYGNKKYNIDDVTDVVDSIVDHHYFGVGFMLKIGMTMGDVNECFHIVADANMDKVGEKVNGKQSKGDKWVDPKEKMRAIVKQALMNKDK